MGLPGVFLDASLFSAFENEQDAERALYWYLEGLVSANIAWLHAHPETPLFYDAKIRYVRDPLGVEWWKGIERIRETGSADCKSLAAWRVAELRCREGEDGSDPTRGLARFKLSRYQSGPREVVYHVTVVRGDHSDEDPSSVLGMGAKDTVDATGVFAYVDRAWR